MRTDESGFPINRHFTDVPQDAPDDPWGHHYLYKFPGDHGDEGQQRQHHQRRADPSQVTTRNSVHSPEGPTLFGLVTAIPEGVLVWLLLRAGLIPGISGTVPVAAFVIDFGLVWLAVWLVANGPMRVPFIRWRFHGGRLV